MNRRLKLLLLAVPVVVVVIGLIIWWWGSHGPGRTDKESELFLPTEIELKGSINIQDYGKATRAFASKNNQSVFLHTIEAHVPNLRNVDVDYYGWLVKPDGKTAVKTGRLIKTGEDEYRLNYTDSKNLQDYPIVWVTLETTDDETPEQKMLEGNF